MELRTLSYFLAVINEENITNAAKALHITQPTLSRQLIQLENELGVRLFKRGRNRITLTAEGRFLKEKSQKMIDLAEEINKGISIQ
jgi:DNA-binding transcriptional LysR family regulator